MTGHIVRNFARRRSVLQNRWNLINFYNLKNYTRIFKKNYGF